MNISDAQIRDVPNKTILVKKEQFINQQKAKQADLLCEFNFTFNGIQEGFQMNLIGAYQSIPCRLTKIVELFSYEKEAGLILPTVQLQQNQSTAGIIGNGNLVLV